MNWFKLFRLVGSKKRPLSKRGSGNRLPLGLEALESREVPAVPVVTAISPGTNGTLGSTITVTYSENVNGETDPNNYRLFASDGTLITIAPGAITSDNPASGPETVTIAVSGLNGGQTLAADSYSLFVLGDRIFSVSSGDPLARPGEVVVASAGRDTISTVGLNGSSLAALASLAMPTSNFGQRLSPTALGTADVNFDGYSDLVVAGFFGATTGTAQVAIYLGGASGRFATTPDATLALPNGASPSALVAADLNFDGRPDIAVANNALDNVTVFYNQTVGSSLAFSAGANFAVGNAPTAIVAGQFVSTNSFGLDLATANNAVTGSNYTVSVLVANTNATGFGAAVAVNVGTNASPPTGVNNPNSLAVGDFTNSGLDDLVVGGTRGVSVLRNTGGAGIFTADFYQVGNVTSVAAAAYQTNSSVFGLQDILATTSGGSVIGLLNNGTGAAFQQTGQVFVGGNSTQKNLALTDLTGDGDPEVLFTSTSGGTLVAHSPIQAGRIADASNANPIVITSANHGLVSGQVVTITGVLGNTNANGTYYVTRIDGDHFSLNTRAGNAAATANTGTWIAVPNVITNVTQAGPGSPVRVVAPNHGLRTGQLISLNNVSGVFLNTTTGPISINASWYVTVIDANTFTLNGTEADTLIGTFTPNANPAIPARFTPPTYPVGSTPSGLAVLDFNNDGIRDVVVSNQNSGDLSFYTGSGTGGFGDGTFYASTIVPGGTSGGGAVDPRTPVVADLNGDGIPDIVVPDQGSDLLTVSLGLRDGGYAQAATLFMPAGSSQPSAVAVGDVNGDGFLDIVAVSAANSNAVVFQGNGDGTFQAPGAGNVFAVGNTPADVALADLNKDGVLDLLVAHNGNGPATNRGVSALLGNGDGSFKPATEFLSGTNVSALAVDDFDRDGNLDFVATNNSSPGSILLERGDGLGGFAAGGSFTVGPNPTEVIVADFNNDGYDDVATVSSASTTSRNISVLINNLGSGFRSALYSTLATNKPLQSITAAHVDTDAFLDLVVTEAIPTFGGGSTPNPGPNNVYRLLGVGDGTFRSGIGYTIGGSTTGSSSTFPPSYAATVSDPFVLLSTFNVVSPIVQVNLVRNGDFEDRALTGEQGNLDGWTTFRLGTTGADGGLGQWLVETSSAGVRSTDTSPLSLTPTLPVDGNYRAILDQQNLVPYNGNSNPNTTASYSGSNALYQDITIPAGATSVMLSLDLYAHSLGSVNGSPWSNGSGDSSALNFLGTDGNMQVRVDVIDPSGNPNALDIGPSVLLPVFRTSTTDPAEFSQTITADLTSLVRGTDRPIRIRIATTNNRGQLIVGVDNVKVVARLADTRVPTLTGVQLRNPAAAAATTTDQSTDLTLVGKVADNASQNNIRQVLVDVNGDGFRVDGLGGSDDVGTSVFDANGYFSLTLPQLLPGIYSMTVRVVDKAGNKTDQVYSFIVQGPSVAGWQSVGPGPIDVTSAGLGYTTISGKITGIALDPRDATGNTIYASAGNGGVWRSTDGGANWRSLTDNIVGATGQRINAPVASIGVASDGTVYAATGVDDLDFTSRGGIGVLKSTDNGKTWQVLGSALIGAKISKLVVVSPTTVYVAVASWDTAGKQPGVYVTTNGGATWANVLLPQNMSDASGTPLLAGTQLASVTDIVVDPFAPQNIAVGLGNIGYGVASATAGVYLSNDGGQSWSKQLAIGSTTSGVPNNKLPEGTGVGRITIAEGTARATDQEVFYVLVAAPPGRQTQPDGGSIGYPGDTVGGLYKTSDFMRNWTKVMLKQDIRTNTNPTKENFVNIDMVGREGGTVGALAVDPNNPNVVYVGGSSRMQVFLGDPPFHSLIRVDTGNMSDPYHGVTVNQGGVLRFGIITNSGDDITKESAAARLATPYTYADGVAYIGEGVYWYDIEQAVADTSTRTGTSLLPGAIHRIVIDSQGRLLFGTENGLYRGLQQGFGYDFSSGGTGLLGGQTFSVPGMTITELNGNLQIADLTSAAVDPNDPNRFYISGSGIGSALTADGIGDWQTNGLFGKSQLLVQNAFQVVASAADTSVGGGTTVYRVWQFTGTGSSVFPQFTIFPEVSTDGGKTFTSLNSVGIDQDVVQLAPVLAVNPVKVNNNGTITDELLFGTTVLYNSKTSGTGFTKIIGTDLAAGDNYSALAFAPPSASTIYYAGTQNGLVFTVRGTATSPLTTTNITGNLNSLVGAGVSYSVAGITVDPNNPDVVYVMLKVPNGVAGLYRTTNAGAGMGTVWTALTGSAGQQLPLASTYSMVIDTRPASGAPNGFMYVGTERGVYVSVNGGTTWSALGSALPAVPVVGLTLNTSAELLVAATQGRGVFTISTARSGPAIVSETPATPTTDGALSQVDVTFNRPVDPRTFTADSNSNARAIMALLPLSTTEYADSQASALVQQYLGRAATQPDINFARGVFFALNSNGSIQPTTNPLLGNFPINAASSTAEFDYTAILLAHPEYFARYSIGYANNTGNNNLWLTRISTELFGDPSAINSQRAGILAFLANASAPNLFNARVLVVRQLIGADPVVVDPSGVPHYNLISQQFQARIVAGWLNQYLGRNYNLLSASPPSSAEISTYVAKLQAGLPPLYALASILGTTEAYQAVGNVYSLPAGVTALAVAYGNLSGATDSFNNPIPDLIVAGSDNVLRIYQGRVGGGYSTTPTLTLNLPAGAAASSIVVADFDGNGKMDIAVANSGLNSASGKSVSVFLNNRGAVGTISFGAITNLDGGNNPVGLAAADIDGDTKLDLVAIDSKLDLLTRYDATVLLGDGAGNFSSPTPIVVGSNTPTGGQVNGPTGIAVGDLDGDLKPELVISAANGLAVFTNTSAAGLPSFSTPAGLLTTMAVTSVAVGNLDASDSDKDIAATTDAGGGQVLVFRNDAGTFAPSGNFNFAANPSPRSLQLTDMNNDGLADLVVANAYSGGGVSVLLNATTAPAAPATPDTISFATAISYPVTGSTPTVVAVGDTNQDGIRDVAVGYQQGQSFSLLVGQQQGYLRVATDRNWMDSLFRTLAGRPYTMAERNAIGAMMTNDALAYLVGPDGGVVAPLSIQPTDSTGLTYRLTFAPQVLDGSYKLVINPNLLGITLKDFVDQNGTYVNTGNALNQNRNAVNGEPPVGAAPSPDQYTAQLAVNHSDDGRFVTAVYNDLLGRAPDNPSFDAIIDGTVEPARVGALTAAATSLLGSAEEVDHLLAQIYQQYLRRPIDPVTEKVPVRNAILNGTSFRDVVVSLVASPEYFNSPAVGTNGTNASWVDHVYMDLLGLTNASATPGGIALVAQLDSGQRTRGQFATLLVYNDSVLQRLVTEYYVLLLGRTPVRNAADPALDETTAGVALLKQHFPAGQLTGDQRLILSILTSPEYLRVHGDSNATWLKSLYTTVLGRSAAPTVGPITAASWSNAGGGTVTITASNNLLAGERVTISGITDGTLPIGYNGTFTILSANATSFTYGLAANPGVATVTNATASDGRLDDLLNDPGYITARQTVLTIRTGSREYRDRVYTQDYAQFLSTTGSVRTPTTAELNFAEFSIYQPYQRLELIPAYIMSTSEFYPLSGNGSDNAGWLSKVYIALLGHDYGNDPNAVAQLSYLNSQSASSLPNARLQVAYQVLRGDEYRGRLVNSIYTTYLGRSASDAEINFWVARMDNPSIADTQQTITNLLLRFSEYFRHRAL